MSDVLLSVVIPIFNAGHCVEPCVNSIVNNNKYNYEIILINDGSEDGTKEVCDRLASENDRITAIHTKNNGQGVARNIGRNHIKGKYVMYIDVDDLIILDGLINMLEIAEHGNYDVVCSTYMRREEKDEILISGDISSGEVSMKGTKEVVDRYDKLKDKSVFGYVWNKLYRQDFLEKHNIKFDEERKVFMEDFIYNVKIMICNPRYYYTEEPSYRFDVRFESTTRKDDPDIAKKTMRTINNFYDFLVKNNIYEENMNLLVPLTMRVFCYGLIKNIPYEGLSIKRLIKRTEEYTLSNAYKNIVNAENASKYLDVLDSLPQKMLYKYCLYCLKHNRKYLIGLTYFMCYPVFKVYLDNNVK